MRASHSLGSVISSVLCIQFALLNSFAFIGIVANQDKNTFPFSSKKNPFANTLLRSENDRFFFRFLELCAMRDSSVLFFRSSVLRAENKRRGEDAVELATPHSQRHLLHLARRDEKNRSERLSCARNVANGYRKKNSKSNRRRLRSFHAAWIQNIYTERWCFGFVYFSLSLLSSLRPVLIFLGQGFSPEFAAHLFEHSLCISTSSAFLSSTKQKKKKQVSFVCLVAMLTPDVAGPLFRYSIAM